MALRLAGLALTALLGACSPQGEAGPGPQTEASATSRSSEPGADYPRVVVVVDGTPIQTELADTFERRAQGLSGRRALAPLHGMLFEYSRAERHGFWMPDMHFDIDIVWIHGERVVDVTHRAAHEVEPPLPVYRPREPADRVLEVPAGTAERLGWAAGSAVEVRKPSGPVAGPR